MSFFNTVYDRFANYLNTTPTRATIIPPASLPPAVPAPVVSTPATAALTKLARVTGATIAIVNQSTVITDIEIEALVEALQIQIDRDVAPAWNISATIIAVPTHGQPPVNAWILAIMDTSDQTGALGYHEISATGLPWGRVFALDDEKYGLSWTVTASHELVELCIDPWASNSVFEQDSNTTGTIFAFEIADPVQDERLCYEINGVKVSDFVYPTWFESDLKPNSTKFDQQNVVTRPFELMAGGYIGTFVVGPRTTGWTQRLAAGVPGARTKHKAPTSRAKRRGIATRD